MNNGTPNTVLEQSILKAREVFSQQELFERILIPNFDCTLLDDPKETDGANLPKPIIDNFFCHLHSSDNEAYRINDFPCLYVFELVDIKDRDKVINAMKDISAKGIDRTLPAMKTTIPDSKYL